jgi:hypothetical protein
MSAFGRVSDRSVLFAVINTKHRHRAAAGLYSTFLKWWQGTILAKCLVGREPISCTTNSDLRQRGNCVVTPVKRDISRAADVGCHTPPRGVGMPRLFNSAAMARTLPPTAYCRLTGSCTCAEDLAGRLSVINDYAVLCSFPKLPKPLR